MSTLFGSYNPIGGATFSDCRRYRYSLYRAWGRGPMVNFIGLNPSTADEVENDPTIRRCISFAKAWGYGGIVMTNIFAWKSTDPKSLAQVPEPVGAKNDGWLYAEAVAAPLVVAAWGAQPVARERHHKVLQLLSNIKVTCLGFTKGGYPRHPLYLRHDLRPADFNPRKD